MSEDKKTKEELKSHNDATVSMAKDFAKEVVGEAVAAAVAAVQAQHVKNSAPKAKALDKGQCVDCRQLNMACGGKHRKMIVLPRVNAEWFDGLRLNGVVYASLGGEAIAVPADCNFEYQLFLWDKNETELMRGRKRVRYSGSIGPNGSGTRPVNAEDFFR